jgi:hypothetical protein
MHDYVVNMLVAVGFVVCFALAVLIYAWYYRRARKIFDRWARSYGFDVISCEPRYFSRGPYWPTLFTSMIVYHVVLLTREGQERRGWVRIGTLSRGVFSDMVEVRWRD